MRGTSVVVTDRLRQRSYETKEGDKRSVFEVEADDLAASLEFASSKVTKVSRARAEIGGGRPNGGGDADPWASQGPGG